MNRKNILLFLFILTCSSFLATSSFSAGNPYIASHGINFAIGNKFHKEADISIDGPVSSLSFTRYYNSLSTADDDLGYGWSHSFADKINVTANVINYTRHDGRVIDYIWDGSSSWVKEAGKVEKITQETDGYYLKEANGTTKKFDLTSYKLLSVTDRHGNTTTLTYSSGQTEITDNFGRQLTLQYNLDGRLEALVTPIGNFTYTYNSGNLKRVYRPDSTTIYREYSYSGTYLTGLTNEVGDPLFNIGYTNGKVTTASLQGGMHPVSIDYQAENLVVVTDETTQETTTYNLTFKHGIAQVESLTGPGCTSCGTDEGSYTYNDRFQIQSTTDANGIKTSYTYDTNGNRETITEADGDPLQRSTIITHDPTTNLVTSITKGSVGSCGGQAIETWTYDGNNNPDYKTESGCSGTSTITRTTDYTYDSYGRITYFNGPRPDTEFSTGQDDITYTYYPNDISQGNKQGMLHTITNGLGHVTQLLEYNGLRKPTLIEDANGVQTSLTYNNFGLLTERTVGARSIAFEYDNAGVLHNVSLPGARTLHYDYQYSANGKEVKITDNDGNSITWFYDSRGNPTGRDIKTADDTLAATINYVHDIKGRLVKTYDGIGSDSTKPGEELFYDNVGNLEEQKILKDYGTDTYLSTIYSYDALNRLVTIQNPGSSAANTIFGYDTHDNQTSVTDDNGVVTTYIFDDFGRRTSEKITENGVEQLIATYEYDLADNLIQKTDGNGNTTGYQYDALNRLEAVTYTDSSQDIAYTYDQDVDSLPNKGRLTSMSDSSGNSSYKYSTFGELTRETRITEGHTFITEYAYNDNGELQYIIYPSGRKITYYRTTTGQLSSIDSLYQGTTGIVANNIRSKPFGPITDITLGNGQQITNTYDTLYRLHTAAVDSMYNRSYAYWSNGQLKTITDGVDNDNNQAFTYDNLDHLDTAVDPYGNLDFDLDGVGNRTSLTDSTTTTSYDYFTGSNRLSQVTSGSVTSYGYDNIGNITTVSRDNTVYNWFDDYRLQSVTRNSAPVGTYKYDGRALRTVKTTNSETTLFIYDKEGRLIAEADNQGNILKEYVYLNNQVLVHFQYNPAAQATSSAAATSDTVFTPTEPVETPDAFPEEKITKSPVSIASATSSEIAASLVPVYYLLLLNKETSADGACYYINDHLGTPQIITDDTGTIVWKAHYTPFGTVTVDPGSTITNNLRFPGQYYDAETGLFYNWHRYYDPETGRYISADPIGLSGGLNLYSYANQNPINEIDPLGLYSWTDLNKAWSHYCGGSRTPWFTIFGSIDWGNYEADLKAKISKLVGGGSCCKPKNSYETFTISAQTGGADAFIIGRHNLKAEGRLIVNADCSWSFSGTISSASGIDPYNFNPSNRGFVGETTTWIGRNRCPSSGRTFDIHIVGVGYINLSGK